MNKILQNELNEVSMKIILYAGDARTYTSDSFKAAKKWDFKTANQLLIQAQDTLMTIISEINISKELISILKIIKNNKI